MKQFPQAIQSLLHMAGIANPQIAAEFIAAAKFLETEGRITFVRAFKFLQHAGTVVLGGGESFTTRDFFTKGEKNGVTNFWFSDEFKSKILAVASAIINPVAITLEKCKLSKDMYDSAIMIELGNPPAFSVDSCLAYLKELISKQPKGEIGELLTNGYSNIFYVKLEDRVVVVGARWGDGEWDLYCREFDGYGEWDADDQVFSPAIVEA